MKGTILSDFNGASLAAMVFLVVQLDLSNGRDCIRVDFAVFFPWFPCLFVFLLCTWLDVGMNYSE